MSRVWYIGPESNVWHSLRNCPRLRGAHRYYPVREAVGVKAERVKQGRRACRTCSTVRS